MSQPTHCKACGQPLPAPDAAYCPKCGVLEPSGGAPHAPPPMQPYPQQVYAQSPPGHGFAITSLVLGIISICTCGWGFLFGTPGVVFGFIAQKHLKRAGAPTAMATAGIVLSIVGIVVGVLFIMFFVGLGFFAALAGD